MEQIVNKIIEVEQRAQEIMNEARKMRDELPETILKDIDKMKEKYTVRAEQRLAIVRQDEQKYLEKTLNEINDLKEKELLSMEEKYEKSSNDWIETLFFRVTGS